MSTRTLHDVKLALVAAWTTNVQRSQRCDRA
jgi:hypothetical protein